jgi:tRNA(Leu) C34 or U34 (ribose-2'-O)-methylase TrmL
MHAVVLIDPKFPHNVGNALRACAVFGASRLVWTGSRVAHPDRWTGSARLPREERMKAYRNVELGLGDEDPEHAISTLSGWGYTPVAIEVRDASEPLDTFVHPPAAVYVFGPEDGTLGRGTLSVCHRFVRIPSAVRTPLNLAAAVNIVLYDRHVKLGADALASGAVLEEAALDEIELGSTR